MLIVENHEVVVSAKPIPAILSLQFSASLAVRVPIHPCHSINRTQQFRLQNKFPLLVLLGRLIRLIIFPPHRLLALLAVHVPNLVAAGRHVAFDGFRLRGIDDGIEEEGFAMLAAEVLGRRCVRYKISSSGNGE